MSQNIQDSISLSPSKEGDKSAESALGLKEQHILEACQLALEHHVSGRQQQAVDICQQVLQVDPDCFNALYLLGVIACQTGKSDIAVALLQKAVGINPSDPALHLNLSLALLALNERDKAEQCLHMAISLKPDFSVAYYNLAVLKGLNGKTDEAIAGYQKAIALNKDYVEAYNNLGAIYRVQSKFDEALECFNKVVSINPNHFMAYANLSAVYMDKGKYDDSVVCAAKSISLNPNYPVAYHNLGLAYRWQDKQREAIDCFRKVIELDPAHVAAYNNLGAAYNKCGQYDEAVVCSKKAIALNPNDPASYAYLGAAWVSLGRIKEAIDCFREALRLNPDDVESHSDLIFCMDLYGGVDLAAMSAERKKWSERHELPLKAQIKAHGNRVDPLRRLRIGYVSADFYEHSASKVFGAMLLAFDRSNFDVFVYANNKKQDSVTQMFQKSVNAWRNIVGLSDETVTEMIRQDEIDILVDLSGHSAGNRLLVFARKPAPVQITAMGYATGSGMQAMDALFSSSSLIPFEEKDFYSEEVVYLPDVLSYLNSAGFPYTVDLPALSNGFVTFGSFNRLAKISDEVFILWAKILSAVPNSRLMLKAQGLANESAKEYALNVFIKQGIDPERISFLEGSSWHEHLKAFNQVDISLDPFPQGGGVTTLESILMGVPALTLRWPTISGRSSASMLSHLGLNDWIAESFEQYVAIAVQKAGDRDALAALRLRLRPECSASVLEDSRRYTPLMEIEYRRLWRKWCAERSEEAEYARLLYKWYDKQING